MEIKLLRHLDHENITSIRDVVPLPLRRQFSDVYIAIELMDSDLHQIIRYNQSLSEEHCQFGQMQTHGLKEMLKIQAENKSTMETAEELHRKKLAPDRQGEMEEDIDIKDDPMA